MVLIIVLIIMNLITSLMKVEPVNAVALINPTPVIERQIKSFHDQNYQMKVGPSPSLNDFKRSDKIQMPAFVRPNFKEFAPYIFLNGSNKHGFYKFFFQMKGGYQDKFGGLLILAIMIFMLTQDTEAFAPAFSALQKLGNFNAPTVNYGGASSSSTQVSLMPAKEFNDFSLQFNEPKKTYDFIMTHEEAQQKVNEKYSGKMEIEGDYFISDRKAAEKIYHAPHLGINSEDFGMTDNDLARIQQIGLKNYAQEGRELPSIEFVKAYQNALKNICENGKSMDGTYSSSGQNKIHSARFFYNEYTREVVGFYQETGELITGTRYRENMFSKFILTRNLGHLKLK